MTMKNPTRRGTTSNATSFRTAGAGWWSIAAFTIALVLILAAMARAQGIGPDNDIRDHLRLKSASARTTAEWTTTILTGVAVAWPCLHDHAHRNWQCVKTEALQVGLSVLNAEINKALVHRRRPNLYDDKSWLSEHTSLTCAATMRTAAWFLCPMVAYGRIAGDDHWASDTAGGVVSAAVFTSFTWGH